MKHPKDTSGRTLKHAYDTGVRHGSNNWYHWNEMVGTIPADYKEPEYSNGYTKGLAQYKRNKLENLVLEGP